MTDQEINVTIANSLGWRYLGGLWYHIVDGKATSGTGIEGIIFRDYCGDLNAIHEVELGMDKESRFKFRENLVTIVVRDAQVSHEEARGDAWCYLISATARQRAEAYLRTTGKWVE